MEKEIHRLFFKFSSYSSCFFYFIFHLYFIKKKRIFSFIFAFDAIDTDTSSEYHRQLLPSERLQPPS